MCGPAFEACTAISHLEAAGVDLTKVLHLTNPGQQPGVSALLPEAARQACIALPTATQV